MSANMPDPPVTGVHRYPRNVYVTTAASLLTDIASEMVVYLLPLFLAGVLKTSTPLIGLIEGMAETTASLTKLASGYLSDRLGNRKWLTVAGYSLSLAVKPFLATATSWQIIFGARFVDRLGKGIRTAPRDALIAEVTPPGKRGAAYGLHRAMDNAGAVAGPLLAAALLGLLALDIRTVLALSAVPAALAVAATKASLHYALPI